MDATAQTTGEDFWGELYDKTMAATGTALEFRLFDTQNCEYIQADWIADVIEPADITRAELDWMIDEGLLQRWRSPNGAEGFLLYSEYQARVAKQLRAGGRYSDDELRHIFSDWNGFLEILMIEDLAYDSFEIDDYDHFRRRAAELVQFFEDDLGKENNPDFPIPAEQFVWQQAEAAERLKTWKWVSNKVSSCPENALPLELQKVWRKQLFLLRQHDEFVRVITAQQFSTQIEQGYSVEITFYGHEWHEGITTLKHLNWCATLRRLKETRNEGKIFPLRTPHFNVTERGIEFPLTPSPEQYTLLYEQYDLGQLSALLEEKGVALWECDLSASGRGECEECGKIFERTTASRKYCSANCRSRAKARRWRQADPERARMAQARYYRESYPSEDE